MGNISQLVLLEPAGSPFQVCPVLRRAKNSIPVLWFALFTQGDIYDFELSVSDGSSVAVPGLCANLSAACERLSGRVQLLKSWLPEELHQFLAQFHEEIQRQKASLIGLHPAELALMHEPEDLQNWMRESTSVFDAPHSDALAGLFDITGLEFDVTAGRVVSWNDRFVEYALCGFR